MEKLIIFYDDTKKSCIDCAEKFGEHEQVECRKISENQEQSIVFATGARVGLIFESENGKLPYGVSHIIWRIVAEKDKNYMILVTGGIRELKAARNAINDLGERGYHMASVYTRYILEKNKVTTEEAVDWILKDIETEKNCVQERVKEKYQGMSRKELGRSLRKEFREYKKYQKKQKKGPRRRLLQSDKREM